MFLSENERKELERFRAERKAKNKFIWAITKGGILSLVFTFIIQRLVTDTPFWGAFVNFGMVSCLVMGILSSYYGPFKEKG